MNAPSDPREDSRTLGALEGTAFGLLAAGAIMGMAWLGDQFGSVLARGEGRYAVLFLVGGVAILIYSLWRREE